MKKILLLLTLIIYINVHGAEFKTSYYSDALCSNYYSIKNFKIKKTKTICWDDPTTFKNEYRLIKY